MPIHKFQGKISSLTVFLTKKLKNDFKKHEIKFQRNKIPDCSIPYLERDLDLFRQNDVTHAF